MWRWHLPEDSDHAIRKNKLLKETNNINVPWLTEQHKHMHFYELKKNFSVSFEQHMNIVHMYYVLSEDEKTETVL